MSDRTSWRAILEENRQRYVEELIELGQMGYIRAIQVKLDALGSDHPEHSDFVAQMRALIDRFDLDQYMATLKTLYSYDH